MAHYGSIQEFVEYHTTRGREIPALWDDSVQETGLLVASEWVDNIYGTQFTGYKTAGFLQVREWPRKVAYANSIPTYLFSESDIPDRLKQAVYEAAFKHLSSPGCLSVDFTPNKYKSVAINGALSVDYADVQGASEVQNQYIIIDQLLKPLLVDNGETSKLSGGSVRI